MTDTKVVSSGVTHAVEFMVTADQTTIVGNGTTEDPLRSGIEAGVQVENDGVIVPGGPFDTLDFTGILTASDGGGGVATISVPRGISLQDDGTNVPDNPHNVLDFTGSGVTVSDSGGGVAQIDIPQSFSTLIWGVEQITLSSGFMEPNGSAAALVATNVLGVPCPLISGQIKTLVIRHNLAGTAGQTITYTVFRNGSSTPLAVAVATGSVVVQSNISAPVDVALGDTISIGVSVSGSPGSNTLNAVVAMGMVAVTF